MSSDLIATALELGLAAGDVVADLLGGRQCIFLAGLRRAEQAIAECVRVLVAGRPPQPGYHQCAPDQQRPDA